MLYCQNLNTLSEETFPFITMIFVVQANRDRKNIQSMLGRCSGRFTAPFVMLLSRGHEDMLTLTCFARIILVKFEASLSSAVCKVAFYHFTDKRAPPPSMAART